MNIPNDTLIRTVPAAAELRRVKGFDPLKFLRKEASTENGQNVIRLDLRYKRLWFRLACPNGRMLLKPLRITDQLAIFEAMVYMNRDDAEPLAQVTSSVTAQEAPGSRYIQAAQDKALDKALENAGFGIQLCDLTGGAQPEQYGSELLVNINSDAQAKSDGENVSATATTPSTPAMATTSTPPSASAPMDGKPAGNRQASAPIVNPAAESEKNAAEIETPAAPAESAAAEQAATVTLPVETAPSEITQVLPGVAPETAPASVDAALAPQETPEMSAPPTEIPNSVLSADAPVAANPPAEQQGTVILFPAANSGEGQAQISDADAAPTPAEITPPMPQATAQAVPSASYTADMTVAEIVERMTIDEAKAVVVTNGVCKGLTIAEVAEKRPASLRYYQCAPAVDNILKAAAQLMLEGIQKAG